MIIWNLILYTHAHAEVKQMLLDISGQHALFCYVRVCLFNHVLGVPIRVLFITIKRISVEETRMPYS